MQAMMGVILSLLHHVVLHQLSKCAELMFVDHS